MGNRNSETFYFFDWKLSLDQLDYLGRTESKILCHVTEWFITHQIKSHRICPPMSGFQPNGEVGNRAGLTPTFAADQLWNFLDSPLTNL